MPQANLTARVEALTAGGDLGLSADARRALEMSNNLKVQRDEYRLPTLQSLEAFRGAMVCDVHMLNA